MCVYGVVMRGSSNLRRSLVDRLEKNGSIRSDKVKRAFLSVPREVFVPEIAREHGLARVYQDDALPTAKDARGIPISSSSQPAIMALMLELLDLQPGSNVLEVGAGTGYNAAVISRIVGRRGRVISIDIEPEFVAKASSALLGVGSTAEVVTGDGRNGWLSGAPYDRIMVTASSSEIPIQWRDQCKLGGKIVMPLRLTKANFSPQIVVSFCRSGDQLVSEKVIPGGFMAIRPHAGAPSMSAFDSMVYWGERIRGRHARHVSISGAVVGDQPPEVRRRLLAVLASTPRVSAIPFVSRFVMEAFLALSVDDDKLVSASGDGVSSVAIMGSDGGSIATLKGKASFKTILCFGDREAENMMLSMIGQYESLGSPALSDLRLEVNWNSRGGSLIRSSWNTS